MPEVVFARFLPSLIFPYSVLWKQITKCSPYSRDQELSFISLRGEYLHQLFGVLWGKFVSSSSFIFYSFSHLYQYGLVDIYFILWIIIRYYVICFVAQIIPALAIRSSFRLVPVCLWHATCCFVFWAFPYFSDIQDVPGSFCMFLALALESTISPRSLVSFD